MEVYIVITEDRHSDLEVEPFLDMQKALNRAKELANKYCRFPKDYEEINTEEWNNGAIFRIEYSCEGDSVTVYRVEMGGGGLNT